MKILGIDYRYKRFYVSQAEYPLVPFYVFNYNNAPVKWHYTFSV